MTTSTTKFRVGERVVAARKITMGRDGAEIAYGERGSVVEVESETTVWVQWDLDGFKYAHNPAHLLAVKSDAGRRVRP